MVILCLGSLRDHLRSQRIVKQSSRPRVDIPTQTPTPSPAFALEFKPEEAIWCVEGTTVEREGSAVGIIWDVVAEVDGGGVVGSICNSDACVDMERVFVDRVFDKMFSVVGIW